MDGIKVDRPMRRKKRAMSHEDAEELLRDISELKHIRVCGLMTIPPFSSDPEKTRLYFQKLKILKDKLVQKNLFTAKKQVELSMGMSGDFNVAIEEGATLVRVGTAIFGSRD